MWVNMYTIPFNLRFDNFLKDIQFKIIHRIVGVNKFLYKIGITDSPRFEFCNLHIQSIEHLFYSCFLIKTFWLNVSRDLQDSQLIENQLSEMDVIRGYGIDCTKICLAVNQIILFGKRFIFNCKQNVSKLSAKNFKGTVSIYNMIKMVIPI